MIEYTGYSEQLHLLFSKLFHFTRLQLVQIVLHDYTGNQGLSQTRALNGGKRVRGEGGAGIQLAFSYATVWHEIKQRKLSKQAAHGL